MEVFDDAVFVELAEEFEPQAEQFSEQKLISLFELGDRDCISHSIARDYNNWREGKTDDETKRLGKYLTYIIARLYIHNSPDEALDFLEDASQNFAQYAEQWWEENQEKLQASLANDPYRRLKTACSKLKEDFNKPLSQISKREFSRFIFEINEKTKTLPTTAGRYELLSKMFGEEAISKIAFNFSASSGFGQTIQKSWMPNNRIDFNGNNWIDLFSALNYISEMPQDNDEVSPLFKDDAREKIATVKYKFNGKNVHKLYVRDEKDFCAYLAILGCKTQAWYKNLLTKLEGVLGNEEDRRKIADNAAETRTSDGTLVNNTPMTEDEVYDKIQQTFRKEFEWNECEDDVINWANEHKDYFCGGIRIHTYSMTQTYFDVCTENCNNNRNSIEERLYYYEHPDNFMDVGEVSSRIEMGLSRKICEMIDSITSIDERLKETALYDKIKTALCSKIELVLHKNKKEAGWGEDDYQIIRKKVNNDFELLGESQSQFDPFLRGALLCALVETGLYGVEEINEIIKECGFIELLPLQNPFDWYIRKVLQKLGR